MGLPRCGLGYVDDNVGRYACEIVSTREISSRADQRTCIPRRGTYDLNTDKGEVSGSSPPRPTITVRLPMSQVAQKYAAILTFPFRGIAFEKINLLTVCHLCDWRCCA